VILSTHRWRQRRPNTDGGQPLQGDFGSPGAEALSQTDIEYPNLLTGRSAAF